MSRAVSIKFLCLLWSLSILPHAASVVGGTGTNIGANPYMVYLKYQGIFVCGGSLIARRYILTAGHCLAPTQPSQITVVAGATLQSRGGVERRVIKYMFHPRFNLPTLNYDVAVLKLASPMVGPNIRPIGLCNTQLRAGMSARLLGWGRLGLTGQYPNQLQTVRVPLISKAQCQRRYNTLTQSNICALGRGRGFCLRDSGSPLIINGRVCGLVSRTFGCATPGYPDIYTSIPQTRAFINQALRM